MKTTCRAFAISAALAAACAPVQRPDYMEPPRTDERVQRIDTLPQFLSRIRAELETGRVQDAWLAYDADNAKLLAAASASSDDPGNMKLIRLVASTDAVLDLVQAFEAAAPGELDALLQRMAQLFGAPPHVAVGFAVSIEPRSYFTGAFGGAPLLLLNGRHPDLADSPGRRAVMARELFRVFHHEREADSPSMGPLAIRLYREGAACFAARQLVPDALEFQVLGVDEEKLVIVRSRERLVANELLAVIDSASELEVARFFDPSLKDPILPPGSGPLIADRLYQRLAAELGSVTKPLSLPPQEFLARVRKHVEAIAADH
jgi:hypothetical protein